MWFVLIAETMSFLRKNGKLIMTSPRPLPARSPILTVWAIDG